MTTSDAGDRPGLSRILSLVLVAGLLAGLAAALFNAVLSEPIIDRAIAFEEAAAEQPAASGGHSHAEGGEPPVSRDGQRAGLWLGWGALGIAWGTLLGVGYFAASKRLPDALHAGWRVVAGIGGWFALSALPFVKYPASPPAVGNPDTINERMRNFVGLEILAVVAVVAAVALGIALVRRGYGRRVGVVSAVVAALLLGALLAAVFPPPEANDAAPDLAALIEEFRRHAFVGQMVFWATLTAGFAFLPRWWPFALREHAPAQPQTGRPIAAPAQ